MAFGDIFKRKPHFFVGGANDKVSTNPDDHNYFGSEYGVPPEIEMSKLYRSYKTCYLLNTAVRTHISHSVGHSFYITANTESMKGKKALREIEKFFKEFDGDRFFTEMALDMFISGNCFMTPLKFTDKGEVIPPKIIKLSSIVGIIRDKNGETTHYTQIQSGKHVKVPASDILHFARRHEDASPWGIGLAQIMNRKGSGILTVNNKTIYRPTLVQLLELLDDMAGKYLYAGLPRYAAFLKEAQVDEAAEFSKQLDKKDPMTNITTNVDGRIDTISLDTANKFTDFMQHIMKMAIMALQDPTIQLWTSLSFTYASSESAMEAMMPGIKGYESDHKKFVEQNILKPIIEYYLKENTWDEAEIALNWGEPDAKDIDAVLKYVEVFNNDLLSKYFNPDDVFAMLQDSGYQVNPTPVEKKPEPKSKLPDVAADDAKEAILKVKKEINHIKQAELDDKIKQEKLKALENVNKRYGNDNAG